MQGEQRADGVREVTGPLLHVTYSGPSVPLYETPAGNVLFLHVPKTGGSSVEHHLDAGARRIELSISAGNPPCSPQHFHAALLQPLLDDVPLRYAFMIVRHPVDRVVSEFKFQTRKPWKFYRGLSFSHWLRYHLKRAARRPYHRDNHFRPQHEFSIPGTEIFRFEDGLTSCFTRLQTVVGLAPPKEEIHLKKSRPVEVDVKGTDLDAIRDFYRLDFERYGYRP